MSITVTTEIFCSWCSNWLEGTVTAHAQIQQSRAIARKDGWAFRWSINRQRFEDVCPDCLKGLDNDSSH
jgi:hypothetical protein